MRNRYPGTCYRCGQPVAKGAGHFEKVRGSRPARWLTKHAECAIADREAAAANFALKAQEVKP